MGKKGTPYEGIPFIDEKEFMFKLHRMYNKKVFQDAITKARVEAVTKKGSTEELPASMSASGTKGEQKKELTLQDYQQITDPNKINEELDRLEQM